MIALMREMGATVGTGHSDPRIAGVQISSGDPREILARSCGHAHDSDGFVPTAPDVLVSSTIVLNVRDSLGSKSQRIQSRGLDVLNAGANTW